jgi:asparagine synthase (glutamine-hydrolysing)
MCGIAGVFNLDSRPVDLAVLERMSGVIAHRGPDDMGIYVDVNVGLVHRRLAIIDLGAGGHQPMVSADGQTCVVFNGEIYNYLELAAELRGHGCTFRSRSDTEVILHAYRIWGRDCVQHFNGMFAIAVWDRNDRSLWLARDRLGVKPLYYAFDGRRLVFGSEIKALREVDGVGRRANPQAIAQYLERTYPVDDQTWFDGVQQLPPGTTAHLDARGRLLAETYWDPADLYRRAEPRDDAPARIRELLEDSVRLRLRSDVPVGAHLSGGLDSSSVVALMSRLSEVPVHTFSGAFAEGAQYDEREFINVVAQRFGTLHHEVVPGWEVVPQLLPTLIWHMDEPSVGPGLLPQFLVCSLSRDHGVTVVNGGQGGDELFGGYPKYLAHHDLAQRARTALGRQRRRLLGGVSRDFHRAVRGLDLRRPGVLADPLANEMYGDVRHYLQALLHVEDRTSMAVSIESRTPLLDYRLVELAASIPSSDKMAGGVLKSVLRDAMRDLLPSVIVDRRDKRGFPTPIGPWMRGPLHQWVRQVVLDPDFLQRRIYTRARLETLLALHRRAAVDATHPLWQALNIALWFQRFDADPAW